MASLRYAEDGEIELKREDGRRHPFEFDSVYKHADGQVEKRSFHCLYLRCRLLKHERFCCRPENRSSCRGTRATTSASRTAINFHCLSLSSQWLTIGRFVTDVMDYGAVDFIVDNKKVGDTAAEGVRRPRDNPFAPNQHTGLDVLYDLVC